MIADHKYPVQHGIAAGERKGNPFQLQSSTHGPHGLHSYIWENAYWPSCLESLLVLKRWCPRMPAIQNAHRDPTGPAGGKAFNPASWGNLNDITLEVMRVVLAAGVFAIGVELPKSYMYEKRKSLIILVVPIMIAGWFTSAGTVKTITRARF